MGKRFGPEMAVTAPIYNIGICTLFKKREEVFYVFGPVVTIIDPEYCS
jgi:hypothetical protein